MKKRRYRAFFPFFLAAVLLLHFSGATPSVLAAGSGSKTVDAGDTWAVSETNKLSDLTIGEGAAITAPEGYNVTLTVDGVETPIESGTYHGDIVLTVTEDIAIEYNDHGSMRTYHIRTAIDVENGRYQSKKSVSAAVVDGKVTDTAAENVSITSVGENFNAVVVGGDAGSSYTINDPEIRLTGNGGNDFAGSGVAILSQGKVNVTVNNASIINHGVIRAAVVVKGDSTMHVNDSYIEVNNGVLPEKIVGMMQVPWVLGLTGNVRATNLIENGTAYYNNTHLKAQAWGVLSTDAVDVGRLYATGCTIETVESGYGAYSIGDCIDTFSGCTFNVTDYGLIMASQGDGVFTDGTVVNSGRFGVMMHSGSGGTLTIDRGSVFNTKSTVIQVKGRGADISVDNAELNSESGVILQAMINDDPHAGGGTPPGGVFGAPTAENPGRGGPGGPGEPSAAGPPPGVMRSANALDYGSDVRAGFKNMTLKGDIVHSMTSLGDMILTFRNATITGAITTATAATVAETPAKEDYRLIGEVVNTYCSTEGPQGLKVSLDKDATWIVDKTSYLTQLTIAESAAVKAPEGRRVAMTVDGVGTEIKDGTYRGAIVLSVE